MTTSAWICWRSWVVRPRCFSALSWSSSSIRLSRKPGSNTAPKYRMPPADLFWLKAALSRVVPAAARAAGQRRYSRTGDRDPWRFAHSTAVDYVYDMSEFRFTLPEDAAAVLGVTPEAVSETVR